MYAYQNIFKRYELKYLLTRAQYETVRTAIVPYTEGDIYGKSTVCNIYMDTPDFLLIRRSIDKPMYKEKLRLRSYGVPNPDSLVFLELKKKCDSVVYKRRISLTEREAEAFLLCGDRVDNKTGSEDQILREMEYAMAYYGSLQPAVFLSYDREAFYDKGDRDVRITFDENILWRDYDLSLCAGVHGTPLLDRNQVLMEIKTGTSIPLWLAEILSQNRLYKTPFSKYGNVYKLIFTMKQRKDDQYA